MLDKKTFITGLLCMSALVLLVANILAPRTASATYETTHDNDFSMVTTTAPGGGDAVWITDKRSGTMVCFVYNPGTKRMESTGSMPIQAVFMKAH